MAIRSSCHAMQRRCTTTSMHITRLCYSLLQVSPSLLDVLLEGGPGIVRLVCAAGMLALQQLGQQGPQRGLGRHCASLWSSKMDLLRLDRCQGMPSMPSCSCRPGKAVLGWPKGRGAFRGNHHRVQSDCLGILSDAEGDRVGRGEAMGIDLC